MHYICDECGEGEMLPTGEINLTNPPKVEHKCNNCGQIQVFVDKKYPEVSYKEVTNVQTS